MTIGQIMTSCLKFQRSASGSLHMQGSLPTAEGNVGRVSWNSDRLPSLAKRPGPVFLSLIGGVMASCSKCGTPTKKDRAGVRGCKRCGPLPLKLVAEERRPQLT